MTNNNMQGNKPSKIDVENIQMFEMVRQFPDAHPSDIVRSLQVGRTTAPTHPIYALMAAVEYHERSSFPGNPIKHAVSPLYNHPAQSRRRMFQELLFDMKVDDLPKNFYSETVLNGDDLHLLLVLIYMARERGTETTPGGNIINIKTTARELMRGLGWPIGGTANDRIYGSIKKLSHNKFLIRDAGGVRKWASGMCFVVGDGDMLEIEIAKPIIEIVNNYFYSISLLFMKTLEMQTPPEPLVNPTELYLTKRQRRMCKKLYVLSKVQEIPKTETWEYYFHVSGEEIDFTDKRRRNEVKKDTFAALSFLRNVGQIQLERDTKGKSVTFQKNPLLTKMEKTPDNEQVC